MMLTDAAHEVLRLTAAAERLAQLTAAVRYETLWTTDPDTAGRLTEALDDIGGTS